MLISPDDRELYVANASDTTVTVIDIPSLTVSDTIADVGTAPFEVVAAGPNANVIYILRRSVLKNLPHKLSLRLKPLLLKLDTSRKVLSTEKPQEHHFASAQTWLSLT